MSFLMGTNFASACNISQLAHPLLKASGAKSIMFVSSMAGLLAINVGSLYGAAKGNGFVSLTMQTKFKKRKKRDRL